MAKKKKKVGGKREGAGRKPGKDGPTELVAVTVPQVLMAGLKGLAKSEGWNKSEAVTEAIRELLKRKSRA